MHFRYMLMLALCLALAPVRAAAEAEDGASASSKVPFQPLPDDYASSFEVTQDTGLFGMLLFTATIEGYERILVVDLDAGRVRRVIDGPGNNSYPAWSPDGYRFAFASDRDGNWEIYLSDWDGRNQRRLTHNSVADNNPAWCGPGNTIVYYSETGKPGKDTNLFTLDIGGGAAAQLTNFSGRNTTPRCSPSGDLIAFSTNRFWPGWDVCLWRVKEGKERCILSGAKTYCRPRFSPDGNTIAYSQGVLKNVDAALYTLNTKEKRAISDLPGREYDITFSPDGGSAVVSAENGQDGIFNLYYMQLSEEPVLKSLVGSKHSLRFLDWTRTRTLELEARRIREDMDRAERQATPISTTSP